MYDTARRVALVKQRVRENTRRRQRREAISLSAFCLMLFTALAGAADALIVRGQTAAQGIFGAMLLREDAGGYVLVAVVSFAAAVVITALCFRLRSKENRRKDGTDKPKPFCSARWQGRPWVPECGRRPERCAVYCSCHRF